MPAIDVLLKKARSVGASDLHVVTDASPLFRVGGELLPIKSPPVSEAQVRALAYELLGESQRRSFETAGELDFAYEAPGIGRFRGNLLRQRVGLAICLRIVPPQPPTLEQVGLPEVVRGFCELHQGVVLVTGPSGSGKTTSLAAMVNHINASFDKHILTIEDPIEYVHTPIKSIVNQREVGTHTLSGHAAMRGALRENPDIILVGELRDPESIELALAMAETGHLVMGTMMTTDAASTIDRLVDSFPPGARNQVRGSLAETLKGVVSQRLLPSTEGRKLVLATEILVVSGAVTNLIREGKTFQLPSIMQTGANVGMRRMDDALLELVQQKRIPLEAALKNAKDGRRFAGLAKLPQSDI